MPRTLPVEPPPQIVGLPRDPRGYHVPAEVPWLPDGPDIASMDPHQTAGLAFLRACVVCGFSLPAEGPVWRNFSQKVAAHARTEGRNLGVDPGFAGHLSCMLYSAFACPYWASPAGRLGRDSLVAPGARRGTRPAILGFQDVLYLVTADPARPVLGGGTTPLIGYVKLVDDLPFRDPGDLLDRYQGAVEHDSAAIDLSQQRAYWQGGTTSDHDLFRVIEGGLSAMTTRPPVHADLWFDSEQYRAFTLPLG